MTNTDPPVSTVLLPGVVHMNLARLSWPQALQRLGCGGSVGRALPSSSSLPVAVSLWTPWMPAPASPWLQLQDDPPVSAWLKAGR